MAMSAEADLSGNWDDEEPFKMENLKSFGLQLVKHSHHKSARSYVCGSAVEIPLVNGLTKLFDIRQHSPSINVVIFSSSLFAFGRRRTVPDTYSGQIIRIYADDDIRAGYARLVREEDNTEVQETDLAGLTDVLRLNRLITQNMDSLNDIQQDQSNKDFVSALTTSVDIKYAIHSPYWPVEATKWISRRRPHSFPSKSVIEQVVRYGCDFVLVSHNRLANNGDWIFSFSRAEHYIIKSWTKSQRKVYVILWMICKKIASRNLRTYFFKTLMFWACEENPNCFWSENLLVQSVRELLIEMVQWLTSKSCRNYFMPDNNMMEHLIDTDLSGDIDALYENMKFVSPFFKTLDENSSSEFILANTSYRTDLPASIKRAFVLRQQMEKEHNFPDSFIMSPSIELTYILNVEVSNIYKKMLLQQKAVSSANTGKINHFFQKAESRLVYATNLCKFLEESTQDICPLDVLQSLISCFIPSDTREQTVAQTVAGLFRRIFVRQHSEYPRNTTRRSEKRAIQKYPFGSSEQLRKTDTTSNPKEVYKSALRNIAIHRTSNIGENTGVELYKNWPSVSPTANVSWFIAKAYLANLYYTTERDASLTIQTCDDVIDAYKKSLENELFAERTFPVALSTQWSEIYDKRIQQMLGFYTLCDYILNSRFNTVCRPSVFLSVCPVQFVIYLKTCVRFVHVRRFWKNIVKEFCVHDTKEFYSHEKSCQCDKNVNNGLLILKSVLRIYALEENILNLQTTASFIESLGQEGSGIDQFSLKSAQSQTFTHSCFVQKARTRNSINEIP